MSSNNDYKIMLNSNIPAENRSSGPNKAMSEGPPNGGLYGGPDCDRPWMPIKITPTATNLISNNLLSANPPPGAIEQYIGTNRLGNNYTSMPEVYWFVNKNQGPYNLKVTK